jgi:hypothetical protein
MHWRHVIVNTHSSWLPGSPRGFRNRKHRIHSSGDYRSPPPPGEHEGLHRYNAGKSSPQVEIPQELQGVVGTTLVNYLAHERFVILAASVSDVHAHFVVELPCALVKVKEIVGSAKERASRQLSVHIDGFRWAAGGTYKLIDSEKHLRAAVQYVATKQEPSAWSWCYRCGTPREQNRCKHNHKSIVNQKKPVRHAGNEPKRGPGSSVR